MNREDIILMADASGLSLYGMGKDREKFIHYLEAFAALVIKPWADQLEVERKKFQELNDVAVVGMQHAREAEREACAKVCDDLADIHAKMNQWGSHKTADTLADAIRARGQE